MYAMHGVKVIYSPIDDTMSFALSYKLSKKLRSAEDKPPWLLPVASFFKAVPAGTRGELTLGGVGAGKRPCNGFCWTCVGGALAAVGLFPTAAPPCSPSRSIPLVGVARPGGGGGDKNGKPAPDDAGDDPGGGSNVGRAGDGGAGHRLPLLAEAPVMSDIVGVWSREDRI